MVKPRWLYNVYNPRNLNFDSYVSCMPMGTQFEAVDRMRKWLVGKTIGEPKKSKAFSVAELKRMDIVGVYEP